MTQPTTDLTNEEYEEIQDRKQKERQRLLKDENSIPGLEDIQANLLEQEVPLPHLEATICGTHICIFHS